MPPPEDNALVQASQWVVDVVTGSIAIGAATIARSITDYGDGRNNPLIDLKSARDKPLSWPVSAALFCPAYKMLLWPRSGESYFQLNPSA